MIYLVYTIHILVSIFLILVVLLQQGKGADLSVFSGGTTQAAFGVRGATTLLHKLTVSSFIVFIITTMAIAVMQNGGRGGASVMSNVAKEERQDLTQPVKGVTQGEEGQTAAPAGTAPATGEAAPATPQPQSPPPAESPAKPPADGGGAPSGQ